MFVQLNWLLHCFSIAPVNDIYVTVSGIWYCGTCQWSQNLIHPDQSQFLKSLTEVNNYSGKKKRAKQCELAHTCFSASSSLCNKRFTYHSLKNFFRELYSFDRKVFSSVIFSSEIIWLSLNAWWSFFLWWIPDTLQNSLHQFESNLLNDSTYPYMTYHYQTLAAISCIVANLLL